MEEELKDVSENIQKLKETNEIEFIKINSYMQGYLAAQKEKQKENKLT